MLDLSSSAQALVLRDEHHVGQFAFSGWSTQSFKLEDILGFVVGATSSRFWMLRKHFNSYEVVANEDNELPFYAWQCFTIETKQKDIDLVIQNDTHLQLLIEFLLYELKSADGMRNSAIPHYDQIYYEQTKSTKNQLLISKSTKREVAALKQFNIFNFTNVVTRKYRIMMFRMKISYMAYSKKATI